MALAILASDLSSFLLAPAVPAAAQRSGASGVDAPTAYQRSGDDGDEDDGGEYDDAQNQRNPFRNIRVEGTVPARRGCRTAAASTCG